MRPHGDLGVDMHELEMTALRHPLLSLVRVVNLDLEVRVGLLLDVDAVPGRKLGVGRKRRAGDVVGEIGRAHV